VFWKKWKLTINAATTKRFVLKKGGPKLRENEKIDAVNSRDRGNVP
jgi:hypothetical protein